LEGRHSTRAIAYYISAHGYGHGVRSTDIIRAVNRLRPDVPVHVVSALPQSFLENRLRPGSNFYRSGSFDFGMVQLDSIRVDVAGSLAGIRSIYARRDHLKRQEISFYRENHIGLVVADIPAIPLEAAAEAGIPGIAVGNFGWDWIYSDFIPQDSGWEEIVWNIREGYRSADSLLRLPFAEPMSPFRNIEDLPIVASPGRVRREEIARLTGARLDRCWVLLSFTTLDWDDAALDEVERCGDFEFFTVLPLAWSRSNIHAVDRDQVLFGDVVASVDAVVSKPGFGILCDCIVNGKPLIYADREDFREYPILVEAIEKYLKNAHIPTGQLYRGQVCDALSRLNSASEPPLKLASGGAEVGARRILDRLHT
jgi:hypothetical protein